MTGPFTDHLVIVPRVEEVCTKRDFAGMIRDVTPFKWDGSLREHIFRGSVFFGGRYFSGVGILNQTHHMISDCENPFCLVRKRESGSSSLFRLSADWIVRNCLVVCKEGKINVFYTIILWLFSCRLD